jgi:hypothetical protein
MRFDSLARNDICHLATDEAVARLESECGLRTIALERGEEPAFLATVRAVVPGLVDAFLDGVEKAFGHNVRREIKVRRDMIARMASDFAVAGARDILKALDALPVTDPNVT